MNSTDPSLNGQGEIPTKAKKPRKSKKVPPHEQHGVGGAAAFAQRETSGRLASDITEERVSWLVHPWIPKGMLSFVVGQPKTGKSTFAAWLISEAGNALLLPGHEERVAVMTVPRLKVNGVNMRQTRILDERNYSFPRDEQRLIRMATGWEAELILLDPVDSYLDAGMSENAGQDVRMYLESLARIASETGAAVVGVRHPGKESHNIMPGSRQWKAVPRSIVELLSVGEISPRFIIRHHADSLGTDSRPRQYIMTGERGEPRRFALKKEIDSSFGDLAAISFNPAERQDVVQAARVIKHLFDTEDEPTVEELWKQAEKNRNSPKAVREALHLCKIERKPMGKGAPWGLVRLSKEWPEWLLEAGKLG